MTTKEALHHLVDELPEEQTELARVLLEDLRNTADGPPLDAESLTSLDRGLADIAAGRVKPPDEYKRERGL
jgi:predicted transcriptional regulator